VTSDKGSQLVQRPFIFRPNRLDLRFRVVVGEGGHYLNRPGERRGGILELIRTHRDRLA
jgi:hypothetical protein